MSLALSATAEGRIGPRVVPLGPESGELRAVSRASQGDTCFWATGRLHPFGGNVRRHGPGMPGTGGSSHPEHGARATNGGRVEPSLATTTTSLHFCHRETTGSMFAKNVR